MRSIHNTASFLSIKQFGEVMRASVLLVGAATTVSLLLAGCSDSATPERAAAALVSAQPVPGDEAAPAEDSKSEEIVASEQPDNTQESSSSEESSPNETDSTEKSMGSKLCMINNSSQIVTLTTVSSPKTILGEIAQGDEQCEDNFNALSSNDVARGLSVNGVELMVATMNNPFVGPARVVMYQSDNRVCGVNDIAGVGKLGGAKDDGVLRYQLMRVTPYSLTPQQVEYQLVLSDSDNPTPNGRPVACS
jgi:hypothetical protein